MSMLTVKFASMLLGALASPHDAAITKNHFDCSEFAGDSFAIYALSKGGGVPRSANDAFQSAKSLLTSLQSKKLIHRLVESRFGLEGERKVCAAFRDSRAAEVAWQDICGKFQGILLLNIVAESCERK